MGRPMALDPAVVVELDWWSWRQAFGGVDLGPLVRVGLTAGRTDAIGTLTIVEPELALGVAARREVVPGVEVGMGIAAGVWGHSWLLTDVDAGLTVDPFVVVPVSVAWLVQPGVGLLVGLDAGSATRTRIHERDGIVGWQRHPAFSTLTVGVKVDLEKAR
jgi:hypothetical protein